MNGQLYGALIGGAIGLVLGVVTFSVLNYRLAREVWPGRKLRIVHWWFPTVWRPE